LKFKSPPYTALIVDVPWGNAEVVKEAEPPVSAPVPSTVAPFLKLTVSPSGGGPAAELTTAVKVTDWPSTEGFSEEESVVVVAAGDGFSSYTTPSSPLIAPPPGVVP